MNCSILFIAMQTVLVVLVIKGILSPLGAVQETSDSSAAIREGILSGYQTMDMMGMFLLSMAVTVSIAQKGYRTHAEQSSVGLEADSFPSRGSLGAH